MAATLNDPRVPEIMKGFRSQYPDYADMTDDDLLNRMHTKFYSDFSDEEYLSRLQRRFAPDYVNRASVGGFNPAVVPGLIFEAGEQALKAPGYALEHVPGGRTLFGLAMGALAGGGLGTAVGGIGGALVGAGEAAMGGSAVAGSLTGSLWAAAGMAERRRAQAALAKYAKEHPDAYAPLEPVLKDPDSMLRWYRRTKAKGGAR